MRTSTANNFDKAFSQLSKIDEAVARKLPRDIKQHNDRMINVVLVRRVNDIARERYITTFVVQAFNERAFAKLEKSFITLGYHTIIILHDPRLKSIDVKPEPNQGPGPILESDLAGSIAEAPAEAPAAAKPFDVNKARVAELREYADDNNIELDDNDLKADIVKKIKAWQDENLLKP